jgi:hypothetical protein
MTGFASLRAAEPRVGPTDASSADEILSCAETLGIPWRRVLLQEIEAEQKLRRYLADVSAECPLDSALSILSHAAQRSWRVRDQVESLAGQARASVRGARRGLRKFLRHLEGDSEPASTAFVRHCGFAYQRILLLQRVRRTAARSRGSMPERLAYVCTTARCGFEDAVWALREEGSTRRGERMEAAIRKVREEGFFVPRSATEARALAELRKIALSGPARSGIRDVSSRTRASNPR